MPHYKRQDVLAMCDKVINKLECHLNDGTGLSIFGQSELDAVRRIRAGIAMSSGDEVFLTLDDMFYIIDC